MPLFLSPILARILLKILNTRDSPLSGNDALGEGLARVVVCLDIRGARHFLLCGAMGSEESFPFALKMGTPVPLVSGTGNVLTGHFHTQYTGEISFLVHHTEPTLSKI